MKRLIFSLGITLLMLTSCVSGYSITSSNYDPQVVVTQEYYSYWYNGCPVDYYNGRYYYYKNNCWYIISQLNHHLICKSYRNHHNHRYHNHKYNNHKKDYFRPSEHRHHNHKKDYYRPSEHKHRNHNNYNINRNNNNTRPRPSGRPSTNRGSSRQR